MSQDQWWFLFIVEELIDSRVNDNFLEELEGYCLQNSHVIIEQRLCLEEDNVNGEDKFIKSLHITNPRVESGKDEQNPLENPKVLSNRS